MKTGISNRIEPTPSLTDRLAGALMDTIASGELAPGDRLPSEVRLVEQFGVSRTVVREAISRLKSEGVVEGRQGSGVYVTQQARLRPLRINVSSLGAADTVHGIIELRRALEVEAAALAAQRRTEPQWRDIERAADDVDAELRAGRDGVLADIGFHRALAVASGNPFIVKTLDFYGQYLLAAMRANDARDPARHREVIVAEHARIVAAVRDGDACAAAEAVRLHLVNEAHRFS